MIPGDHHRPDPGRPARADGLPRLLTRRIDHSDKPQEGEFGLHVAGVGRAWDGVEATVGESEHAERLLSQAVAFLQDAAAALRRHGLQPPAALPRRAAFDDALRGALDERHDAAVRALMDRRHALALGFEGDLGQPGPRLPDGSVPDAGLLGQHQERCLRGVSLEAAPPVVSHERGVVAQSGRVNHPQEGRVG